MNNQTSEPVSAKRVGQLDPQSVAVQSVGVLDWKPVVTRGQVTLVIRQKVNVVEFSVNQAIERVSDLQGAVVNIYGTLSLEFESRCVTHIPRAEIHADSYQSSIWVDFDLNAIGQPEQWLNQFNGRHVHVTGVLTGPDHELGGCGHFSLWPVELVITAIQKK